MQSGGVPVPIGKQAAARTALLTPFFKSVTSSLTEAARSSNR